MIAAGLAGLNPAPTKGVRPVADAGMHITLHFIGRADVETIRQSLSAIRENAFPVLIGRPGEFRLRGQRRILYMSVEPSQALLRLHAQVGSVLESDGFRPETRPYHPHVTLARLGAGAPRDVLAKLEAAALADAAREFLCKNFALFASETAPEGARYRIVRNYPLSGAP